jgi:hypothetical protein
MNPTNLMRRILPLLSVAVMLFVALTPLAQTPGLRLSGIVHDPTAALIPGATVKLTLADGSIVGSAVTDANGRFQMLQPAGGDYRLRIVRPGFASVDAPLHVPAKSMPPLQLTMQLADVTTTVNVSAAADLDVEAPANNKDAATVSASDMKDLPVFDGDIVATLGPFLDTDVAGEGGATLMVDGVERSSVGVSASAIERVSINQDPYSAEYRQPGRGQLEIITKATADRLHGEASFTFRDDALNGTNYFATSKPPEQRRIYEGYLTGPVRPLHSTAFLFSFTRKEEDTSTQVLATTLPTAIPAQNVFAPSRSTQLSMKLSRQYNDHHSGFVLYTFSDTTTTNQTVGGLVQASAGYVSNDLDQQWTYHDDLTVTPHILNQFTLEYERDIESAIGKQQAPQINVEGIATFGGAQSDAEYTNNNPPITDEVSWTLATKIPQQLKFGVQLTNQGRRLWVDHTNRQGTYTFASAAAYLAGTPSSLSIQQGQDRSQTFFQQQGAFILDQIQLTNRLTVTPGLRYDFQGELPNTKNGFLPRLSIAYLLDKAHAMVVRVGGGLYIRRVGANVGQQLARYQFAAERNLLLTSNICYPTCSTQQLAAEPPSLFQYQPGLQSPEQGYFGMSLERQVKKDSTVTLSYNGYRGWHALRSVDVNAPLPPFTSPARPNATLAQVLQLQSQGYQKTDGMSVSYRGRIRNVFSGFVQYTLQHADTNTQYSTFIPQNQYDPNDEWARSDYDQRQRLSLFGTLYPDKPVTLGIGFYNNTPLPYTITTGTDAYQTGLSNARPAGVPRNSLNGGSFQDVQLRVNYTRKLRPRTKGDESTVAFSVSSFDTLNRVNFETFDGVLGSPDFKQPTTASDPRRLQLEAVYSF